MPKTFHPCSLNISGKVIHSAPGEPVVSMPLALKFVLKVQTLVESGRFPVRKELPAPSNIGINAW